MDTKNHKPLLEGESFVLRHVTVADAPLIFKWLNVPGFHYYRPSFLQFCPTVHHVAKRILTLSAIKPPLEIEALAIKRTTSTPIGLISLSGIDRINQKAEFSFGFVEGHGTRCLLDVIGTSLEGAFSMDLHKLIFYVTAENTRMLQAMQRYGIRQEGLFKEELMPEKNRRLDIYRFALLDYEWHENPLRKRLKRVLAT